MAVTRTLEKAATGETPRPPLSPRGLRSRTAIVDAAATMMRHSGVASTSLDDVLAAAGCGKSQLYHYSTTEPTSSGQSSTVRSS
ncbi:TetR/AcrR family transcriptional regulator [Mycolicibacter arupensis]|jgi:AcrR family transcriptional regulator|uniref:TetR/AcrR family transcriptional regulator n=1 Tax=Mycolicibacter arupensis TaxID=342002 RepID=UPI0023F41D48|nr:TetR/AcrR family transcriptional regulator [Mycolicibacter arupensis]